jgi:hypothetical protein
MTKSAGEHVGKATEGGRARAPYIPLIEDALQDPDEVYLQEVGGESESQPRIMFFQFYQDMPFKVVAKLTNEGVYILSWYPPDDKLGEQGFSDSINGQRYGILMFHKQKNAR